MCLQQWSYASSPAFVRHSSTFTPLWLGVMGKVFALCLLWIFHFYTQAAIKTLSFLISLQHLACLLLFIILQFLFLPALFAALLFSTCCFFSSIKDFGAHVVYWKDLLVFTPLPFHIILGTSPPLTCSLNQQTFSFFRLILSTFCNLPFCHFAILRAFWTLWF